MLFDMKYFKLEKAEKEDFNIGIGATSIIILFTLGIGFLVSFGAILKYLPVYALLSPVIGMLVSLILLSGRGKHSTFSCIGGLITGFFFLVIFSLAIGYIDFVPFIILTLIVSEIFFWLDTKKPQKGDNVMEYTFWRKLDQIAESIIWVGILMALFKVREEIINVFGQIFNFFAQNFQFIIQILTWVGIIALIIGGSYAFIWVNSLKYRKVKGVKR